MNAESSKTISVASSTEVSFKRINVGSIIIEFPFEPYEVQTEYMNRVVECLTTGKFGLLESPTGTGKTLSLLCSSLAWLEHDKFSRKTLSLSGGALDFGVNTGGDIQDLKSMGGGARSKIVYSSRTHSQLAQVIKEFAGTSYRRLSSAVLGSRDQLCINQSVLNTNNIDKNILCRSKVRSKSCEFYNNLERTADSSLIDPNIPLEDIEDLKKLGTRKKICPYYLSRQRSNSADILFLPYNYLLDEKIRKTLNVDLEAAIVILDEAHNVLRNCEDANSLTFEAKDLALALGELDYVLGILDSETSIEGMETVEFTVPEICSLKEIFVKAEKSFLDLSENSSTIDFGGEIILDICCQSGISSSSLPEVTSLLTRISDFLTNAALVGGVNKGKGVSTWINILNITFKDPRESLKSYFKLHIQKENGTFGTKKNVIYNLWCFSPGFCMNSLAKTGVRSVILTSGTLKPMNSFGAELDTNFGVTLSNKHVIETKQLFVRVIPQGPDNIYLTSTFQTRSDPKYLHSLGVSILKIFRNTPDGVLVFFPSYTVMNSCVDYWQNHQGLWSSMSALKPVYLEPKTKGMLNQVVDGYRSVVKNSSPKGACFMAVMRGKVAEGIDFADQDARAVIVTGIPFPNVKDARICLKRKYLDSRKATDKKGISGSDWYNLEAYRAVNQAIGRVIRHKNDYGAVFFMDRRFGSDSVKLQLSDWIQPGFKISTSFDASIDELKSFFKTISTEYPVFKSEKPKPELNRKSKLARVLSNDTLSPLPPLKKKKIVLKPRSSQSDDNVLVTEPNPKNSATNLVVKLKKSLEKSEMDEFKKLVKNYKSSSDFSHIKTMVSCHWFMNKLSQTDKSDFKNFVKDAHKSDYGELIQL